MTNPLELLIGRSGCILLLALLALPQSIAPAVITVEGDCTLVDAITAANTDSATGDCPAGSGADEIQLTEDVVLTAPYSGENGLPTIETYVTIEGGGFTLRREANAPDFRLLTLSSPLSPVFGGANLTLKNLTVSNGRAGDGGAIWTSLSCCTDYYEALYLINSTLTGNEAIGRGGAIFNNYESFGFGYVVLSKSSLSNNVAGGRGGGLYAASYHITSLVESTVSGNVAGGDGGGIFGEYHSDLTLTNSTLSGNTSAAAGGGLHDHDGYGTTLINSTASGNAAAVGGGVSSTWGTGLHGSIVANNVSGGNCSGTIVDLGGNLADDDSCGTVPSTLTGLDPILADNGGPTLTHALLEGSSAIDIAGDCGLETDQRGFLRDDGACDSGSFEFGAGGCVPPPGGMVGWWPGDGNARDIAAGNDGALSGGVSFVPAAVDDGFLFDGIDGFVEVADALALDLTTAVTIDAWIEVLPPLEGSQSIAFKRRLSDNSGYRLGVEAGGAQLIATVFGAFDHRSSATIPVGVPVHVAWTYSQSLGVSTLYVNGEVDSTLSSTAPIATNDEPLWIGLGRGVVTDLEFTHAVIDEIEVFERALAEGEIRSIFDAGASGKCKDSRQFNVQVEGACPGEITIDVTTADPDTDLILFAGTGEGTSYVPWGPCGGTELDVLFARQWRTLTTDGNGEASITRSVGSNWCGRYLQALDRSCATSNVAAFPD